MTDNLSNRKSRDSTRQVTERNNLFWLIRKGHVWLRNEKTKPQAYAVMEPKDRQRDKLIAG